MKGGIDLYQSKKLLLVILLAAAAVIIWLAAVTSGSRNADRQNELMDQAQAYLDDLVYVRAVPLLRKLPPSTQSVPEKLSDYWLTAMKSWEKENRIWQCCWQC